MVMGLHFFWQGTSTKAVCTGGGACYVNVQESVQCEAVFPKIKKVKFAITCMADS